MIGNDNLDPCARTCAGAATAEQLNRECYCLTVDELAVQHGLAAILASHGLPMNLAESHAHLFSPTPVFVSSRQLAQMERVVAAVDEVTALPGYQSRVLSWAPAIAGFDPGSPGGLLGLDFHLDDDGPRLIEINTNPGGALINVLAGQAHRSCAPGMGSASAAAETVERGIIESLLDEWSSQRETNSRPGLVAIVDDFPEQQYLYPEFVLYRELIRSHGMGAEICSPADLRLRDGRLWLGDAAVDLVYNRLTDFDLRLPGQQVLREAYRSGAVAVTPHPRAHALFADKRNLVVLGDAGFLREAHASQAAIDALSASVPATTLVTPANRDALWGERRRLFFKPANGFGSKAGYRGDKLTRRVWNAIGEGTYVAQQLVAPSERHIAAGSDPLKIDIRCYAYRGRVLLYAARLYRGQTTNFRTPGGGFAPVMTRLTG